MKKLLLASLFSLPLLVSAQSFDPIRSQFGISVGPLGRFDGNGAGLSNVVASGSGGWTGNPNQFAVFGGYTNLKSDLLLTNLNLYYNASDPLTLYYFGEGGAVNLAFNHQTTNQFSIFAVDTIGIGFGNYNQSKYAVLAEDGTFVLTGGAFTGSGTGLTGVTADNLTGLGSDPNADRIVFWDDSAGAFKYLTAGTGLSLSGTTLTATGTGTGGFWVQTDSADAYTNLFGDRMEITGAYHVLTVGTNIGNNVQISDGISSFPNGIWIDAGAQEYFVGKISVGTSRGQFQLGSGAVSNLTATGTIYAPSNNITGGISAGSITTTTLNVSGSAGIVTTRYSTNQAGAAVSFVPSRHSYSSPTNYTFTGVSNKDSTGTNYNTALLMLKNISSSNITYTFTGAFTNCVSRTSTNWSGNVLTLEPGITAAVIVDFQEGGTTNIFSSR